MRDVNVSTTGSARWNTEKFYLNYEGCKQYVNNKWNTNKNSFYLNYEGCKPAWL